MKMTLLFVGKTTDKNLQTLVEDYLSRVNHYVGCEVKVIPELRNVRSLTQEQQKEREADLILQQLMPQDYLVLLDERGREYRRLAGASVRLG